MKILYKNFLPLKKIAKCPNFRTIKSHKICEHLDRMLAFVFQLIQSLIKKIFIKFHFYTYDKHFLHKTEKLNESQQTKFFLNLLIYFIFLFIHWAKHRDSDQSRSRSFSCNVVIFSFAPVSIDLSFTEESLQKKKTTLQIELVILMNF